METSSFNQVMRKTNIHNRNSEKLTFIASLEISYETCICTMFVDVLRFMSYMISLILIHALMTEINLNASRNLKTIIIKYKTSKYF